LCSVATCGLESRQLAGFESLDIKVWFGLLHPVLEPDVDYVSEEDIGHTFTPEGHATLLPYGPALVEVAQAHFAFSTADEGLPDGVPECPPAATEMSEQRLQRFSEAYSS
jgi:hypothetical protein